MRLPEPLLPMNPDTDYARQLNFKLKDLLRLIVMQVNGLGDGRLTAVNAVAASVPTTGIYAQGDFVSNSAPSEVGTAASKYVIEGWLCTASGTPGTFVQKRFLTGN